MHLFIHLVPFYNYIHRSRGTSICCDLETWRHLSMSEAQTNSSRSTRRFTDCSGGAVREYVVQSCDRIDSKENIYYKEESDFCYSFHREKWGIPSKLLWKVRASPQQTQPATPTVVSRQCRSPLLTTVIVKKSCLSNTGSFLICRTRPVVSSHAHAHSTDRGNVSEQ